MFYIIYASEVLPFILCLYLLKSIKSKESRVFFYYLTNVVFFLTLLFFARSFTFSKQAAVLIQKIYPLVETILLCCYFNFVLSFVYKRIAIAAGILFVAATLVPEFLNYSSRPSFVPMAVEGMFFILLILCYFYQSIVHVAAEPIYRSYVFWVMIAFLLNFSGTFFLFLFSNSVPNKDLAFINQYNVIYTGFTVIKDILLCIAVWVNYFTVMDIGESRTLINSDLEHFSAFEHKPNL